MKSYPEKYKYNLISQLQHLGSSMVSHILDKDIGELIQRIGNWNERDVEVNDEYSREIQYYTLEHALLYPKLIEKLQLEKGQKVLEVGIGGGDVSLYHMTQFDYYAVDSSIFFVYLARENAKKLGIPQNRVQYSPEGSFNFNEEFDATFCVSVLHEANDQTDLLRKMTKSLKKKGRIVTIERITDILETPEHYQALLNGEKEIPAILQDLGFHTKIENFFASYSGCNFNQKYKFSLVYGERQN